MDPTASRAALRRHLADAAFFNTMLAMFVERMGHRSSILGLMPGPGGCRALDFLHRF